MKKIILIVALTLFYSNSIAFGIKNVKIPKTIITATKYPEKIENIGNVVQVINREELDQLGVSSLKEALKQSSAIAVADTGHQLSFFVRGFASNHTKILVDGIEMKDPITPQGTPYLDAFSLDNVERIEIIKGAKSVLYGSEAITGVINIITKRKSSYYDVEYSDKFLKSSLGYNLYSDQDNYFSFGCSRFLDQSLSSFVNTEEIDDLNQNNFHFRFGQKIFGTAFSASFIRNQADIDLDGNYADDPNYHLNSLQDLTTFRIDLPELENFKTSIIYNISALRRHSKNPTDNISPQYYENAFYTGQSNELDVRSLFQPYPYLNVFFGANSRKEFGKQDGVWISPFGLTSSKINKDQSNYAYYAAFNALSPIINFGMGVRRNFYSGKEVETYSLSLFKKMPVVEIVVKGNFNSGYREPSLYEKYSEIGDPALRAETSENKEISFEKTLFNTFFRATYFNNRVNNKIDWAHIGGGNYKYVNLVDLSTASGTEFSVATYDLFFFDFLKAEFIRTSAKWGEKKATRVPARKFVFSAGISFNPISLGINYISVTERFDGWHPNYVRLAPYSLVNVKLQYILNAQTRMFIKCNNFFNQSYTELNGYSTHKREFFIGFSQAIN